MVALKRNHKDAAAVIFPRLDSSRYLGLNILKLYGGYEGSGNDLGGDAMGTRTPILQRLVLILGGNIATN